MVATTDEVNTNPLSGIFWGNDPNINQQLRQRIALSMLSQKKGFPKTLGEGLTAIGDSLGDIGMMRRLEQSDLAQQAQATAAAQRRAPAQAQSYAPSSDTTETPAAVRAIDEATSTKDAEPQPDLLSTAEAQPAEMLSSAAPTGLGGATPVTSAQTAALLSPRPLSATPPPRAALPPDQGGYNFLDAQAGGRFRPTPGYLQDVIAAREPDPDMQAYYGALSATEAPKGARDVSPRSGAAGPYQFTRGTGKDYGIPGDARFDPAASTDAVRSLTANNAALFQRINGRPPTYQELALMHQQGGQTGANMVAGTGNAPPGNLSINNINPSASPAQAVGAINSFYGMPRDRVAAALMQQRSAVPQPNPTDTGAAPPQASVPSSPSIAGGPLPDQRLAFAPSSSLDIPPRPSQMRPTQVAQAQSPPPGYIPPQPDTPKGAPTIGMSPREIEIRRDIAAHQGNAYYAGAYAPELEGLVNERTIRQNEANKLYEAEIARGTEQQKLRLQAQIDAAKRIADVAHTQAQTRKEGIIENPEEKYIMGPDGVVRPIRVEGEDPNAIPSGKLTEDQRKTLVYHGWAKTGNQAITGNDQLLAHGLQQELLGKIPFAGNAVQNDAYRRAKNGADNFILAFMRSTSGAQYGATERLDHAKAMLPRYGDDPKTLADKAAQRQRFVDSEYAGLGKQGQKMADYLAKSYDPGSAENRQRLVDIEMQGIRGSQVGEVKTNRKTGAQRMWNGTRWVETQ
jgi:hypothetical protein